VTVCCAALVLGEELPVLTAMLVLRLQKKTQNNMDTARDIQQI